MAFSIDQTPYDKATHYPVGHGYGIRPRAPTSLVIHSTNNPHKDTTLASEAKFLFESAAVSADFLIGKAGEIIQFLDSARFAAWHAGGRQDDGIWTAKAEFANPRSIGVELHHSIGDPPYPAAQIDALTWLTRTLMRRFSIPISLIDTHRAIALPARRKSDPNDWSDADFYAWRGALVVPVPPPDPLKAAQLPGTSGIPRACSALTAGFYLTHGGAALFGLATGDEKRAVDALGQPCTVLPCERAIIKTIAPAAPHLALLAEAQSRGWIV